MLVQEREISEKLQMRIRELELCIEQQQQQRGGRDQLDSSQDELKRSSTHDVKALKLKARLGEEKIRELEKDAEKTVK